MCFASRQPRQAAAAPAPVPPPAPPPPVPTAAVVQPASRREGSKTKRRRGTAQLTVRRPSVSGYSGGSGVNMPN